MADDRMRCILAAGAADGGGVACVPAAICVRGEEIVGVEERDHPPDGWPGAVVDCRDQLVIPALVNAHCHLDLTSAGPQPYGGDFMTWLRGIMKSRSQIDDAAVAASVREGVELARRGGTGLVGDIAGASCVAAVDALRASGMAGVSYFEVFGQGPNQQRGVESMQKAWSSIPGMQNGVQLGLSPHTPFSCGMDVFRAAASIELPLCTHLAESPAELEFVEHATGQFAELVQTMGGWDDSIRPTGRHAVDEVLQALDGRPVLAAHLNYIEEHHLAQLAGAAVSVAYCPRASAYFGHPVDGCPHHQYQAMMNAGINVALGTDSIICLDTPDRISVLDEMRFLHRRDHFDSLQLLRMATINGARSLGFDDSLVRLNEGMCIGLLALPARGDTTQDMLRNVLLEDSEPQWVLGPVEGSALHAFHHIV